jgi:hypothetical protein
MRNAIDLIPSADTRRIDSPFYRPRWRWPRPGTATAGAPRRSADRSA